MSDNMDRTINYNEALVTFRDLLEPLDENDESEYMRGGVGLMADLFGVAHMDTGERMEKIADDLRRIPAFAKPDDLAQYGVEPYVNCEGCDHCRFPGVRWPASPDGDTTHSYGERCDYCERFEDDYDAMAHVAQELGCNIGIAYRCIWDDNGSDAEVGDIFFEPQPPSDAVRQAWIDSDSGTSLFLDRPERDN